jgi:transcriptional regulator with XRE-family HTH domain
MANKISKNRLRELRETCKLTQQEVAKLLDIDHTTVSRHESGSRSLGPEDIQKYARLYKVESYELFIDPKDLQEEDEAENGTATTGE